MRQSKKQISHWKPIWPGYVPCTLLRLMNVAVKSRCRLSKGISSPPKPTVTHARSAAVCKAASGVVHSDESHIVPWWFMLCALLNAATKWSFSSEKNSGFFDHNDFDTVYTSVRGATVWGLPSSIRPRARSISFLPFRRGLTCSSLV